MLLPQLSFVRFEAISCMFRQQFDYKTDCMDRGVISRFLGDMLQTTCSGWVSHFSSLYIIGWFLFEWITIIYLSWNISFKAPGNPGLCWTGGTFRPRIYLYLKIVCVWYVVAPVIVCFCEVISCMFRPQFDYTTDCMDRGVISRFLRDMLQTTCSGWVSHFSSLYIIGWLLFEWITIIYLSWNISFKAPGNPGLCWTGGTLRPQMGDPAGPSGSTGPSRNWVRTLLGKPS